MFWLAGGFLSVNVSEISFDEVHQLFSKDSEIEPGGHWRPKDCKPRWKVRQFSSRRCDSDWAFGDKHALGSKWKHSNVCIHCPAARAVSLKAANAFVHAQSVCACSPGLGAVGKEIRQRLDFSSEPSVSCRRLHQFLELRTQGRILMSLFSVGSSTGPAGASQRPRSNLKERLWALRLA